MVEDFLRRLKQTALGLSFLCLLVVGLTAESEHIIISKIAKGSLTEIQLFNAEQLSPVLPGYGRPIFNYEISFNGISAYEMTYQFLPGSDCWGKWCFDALTVYIGKDKKLVQLNFCPIGYERANVVIRSGDRCLQTFQRFLEDHESGGRLSREERAWLFITLCCHRYVGDFPDMVMTGSSPGNSEAAQPKEQQECLQLMRAKGIKTPSHPFIVAKFAKHLTAEYVAGPVQNKWWHPLVLFQFEFTRSGRIKWVRTTVLNRPNPVGGGNR